MQVLEKVLIHQQGCYGKVSRKDLICKTCHEKVGGDNVLKIRRRRIPPSEERQWNPGRANRQFEHFIFGGPNNPLDRRSGNSFRRPRQ